ncbi:baculoviral IAP repeat-containing protein 2-like [Saccostrea echinata]|uniref:baculoviral IAP repeat-containing protein 2-like n=1 Tax=Saccostrea echinata TaxID=191078 RepID=UPI002A81C2DA|nr:baculoviral IAP repeat-containing protein 2-like [Saccostrea echinata]
MYCLEQPPGTYLDYSLKYSTSSGPPFNTRYPAYRDVRTRFLSFNDAPHDLLKMANVLSDAGYYYEGYNRKTSCFACGVQKDNWSEWDNALEEHFKDNPICWHVLLMRQKLELENRSYEPVHRNKKLVSTSRFPEYATEKLRTSSFQDCKNYLSQKAPEIAKSGLYYKGFEKKVQCFHCGIVMSIGVNDDPTEKHSRLSPDCEFLRHEVQTLSEDADRIRNQLLCKICLNSQVNVTFRPCGHLATCQDCADQLQSCPICRMRISEKVKTYF